MPVLRQSISFLVRKMGFANLTLLLSARVMSCATTAGFSAGRAYTEAFKVMHHEFRIHVPMGFSKPV
jgi:hypothetical protein